MTGPCSTSPTHSSLHWSASNRPNTAGGAAAKRSWSSSSCTKWRCKVRSEGAHPDWEYMIRTTCAAVRRGFSFLSATAISNTSAGVRADTRAGVGTSASNPPARQRRIHRSIVWRDTRTRAPNGSVWACSASSRTCLPRWRADSCGSITSWISS